MLGGGSAGRATGRPPVKVVDGITAAGWAARAAGLTAAFFFVVRAAAVRVVLRLAVVRFLVADFLATAFFAVLRLAVVRLAVDFLPPARFAVLRLAVDFFEDFFFAGISPPFGCAMHNRALWFTGMGTRCCYLRFIASASAKDKRLAPVFRASVADHATGPRTRVARANQHCAVQLDQLRRSAGLPVAHQRHAVAPLLQTGSRPLPESTLEAQRGVRPRGRRPHRPAGCVN